jgi:hypothetical protein
MEYENKEGNK